MGHFIGVYSVAPAALEAVIGSKDRAKYDEIVAAVPKLREDEGDTKALMRLIERDFAPGEAEDVPFFVSAFGRCAWPTR